MSASVASVGPYALAALDIMAPRIDMAAFRSGQAGHVVAMEAPPDGSHPPLLIARLRDVVCVPGGIVVRQSRVLAESVQGLGADATHPHMLRDRAGDWHLHQRGGATGPIANRIEEPVLWLDDAGDVPVTSAPMLELASRLWAADYVRAFLGIERLRSLTAWPAPPWAPKLVEAAGIGGRDVFFFDRPILCDELIVATRAQRIPAYSTPAAAQFWARVTERFAPRAAATAQAPRLFLSRRAGPERALLADGRVAATLFQHGFTEFDPDAMDIIELARLVSSASLIAGVSGGGLAALGFARRASGVLAIRAPGLDGSTERLLLADRPDIALHFADGLPSADLLDRFVAGQH